DTAKREPNRSAVLDIAYDLVIIDEAHKLKNAATRNWQLIDALRKKYLLLVTATPVQNDVRDLYNLVQLLYPGRLGSARSFASDHVQTKRCAKDPAALRRVVGDVMVRNRRAHTDVEMTERHVRAVAIELSNPERQLYDELTAFVRDQYIRRTERKRSVLSLITLQREICSSSYAAIRTLEAMQRDKRASAQEILQLRELVHLAESVPSYAKVNHVIETIRTLDDKVIIFTEYRATQDFLYYMLQQSGVRTVLFRGGYRRGKKDWMKDLFERRAQVLIATEAGGEGINLQFCNRVINYDLPWNPMRVEQRIGRVHRVGQTRPVFIENYATVGTIEEHIVRLLQDKIRLFESIVGELDVILGSRAFEEGIMHALATSGDDSELRARLSALAGRVKRADGAREAREG
ncbi:MAG: SNF2-related protein, partial [Firmicutes bacterium]|nr:SNF2-related protein [Bacillota bacterium]